MKDKNKHQALGPITVGELWRRLNKYILSGHENSLVIVGGFLDPKTKDFREDGIESDVLIERPGGLEVLLTVCDLQDNYKMDSKK